MNNIFVLNKNYSKIGTLSNQGANPQAPYYNDLYVQDLETGADTYEFSTMSSKYTQDLLEIGNYIMFSYRGRNELFTITSLEYSHSEGYKTIGVYAEGVGFDLLEVYMERPSIVTDEDRKKSRAFCLDVEGNIIYKTEDGGNIPDEDRDLVSLNDEGGYIVYKPSKNNKKNDTLEFHNIDYVTFINILLKDAGWAYVCQPGLKNIKYDITVKYDTNIYAILQDSMQAYRGVELEFVHEYNNGSITKIIKAYKDGGRGSFVGKRFEYGTNVRGITKLQEVANSEDDTVLRIDNVGIDITYDVDFALKSAEVPEIEIGDTHYVIDRDFYPPMTIKARIGKIEVSFSDPTVNKIYLANNKRISGSAIEDDLDIDDIKDILDDDDDIIDDPETEDPDNPGGGEDPDDPSTPMVPAASSNNLIKAPRIHSHEFLVYVNDDHMQNDLGITEVNVPTTGLPPSAFYDYIMDEGNIIVMGTPDDLGAIAAKNGIHPSTDSQPCLRLLSKRACSYDAYGDPNNGSCYQTQVQRSIFSTIINEDTDKDDFGYYTREKNDHGDEHLLDVCSLTCATILALRQHLKKDHSGGSSSGGDSSTGGDSGSSSGPSFDGNGNIQTTGIIQAAEVIGNDAMSTTKLTVFPWEGGKPEILVTRGNGYDDNAIGTRITPNGIEFPDHSTLTSANGLSGEGVTGSYATEDYVDNQINGVVNSMSISYLSKVEATANYATIEYVDSKVGSSTGGTPGTGGSGDSCGVPAGVFDYEVDEYNNKWLSINSYFHAKSSATVTGDLWVLADPDAGFENGIIHGGRLELTGDLVAGKGEFNEIDCPKINGNSYPSSDISLKENIRYIDAPITYSNEDLLEKTDLYDFIVNQVNICEYNFIGDDADKIGFIANDYEGTKVGDKIVIRNKKTDLLTYDISNLLFATIGALQEEVRTKDEKIATLEDRLARIEAMLGINNDN